MHLFFVLMSAVEAAKLYAWREHHSGAVAPGFRAFDCGGLDHDVHTLACSQGQHFSILRSQAGVKRARHRVAEDVGVLGAEQEKIAVSCRYRRIESRVLLRAVAAPGAHLSPLYTRVVCSP